MPTWKIKKKTYPLFFFSQFRKPANFLQFNFLQFNYSIPTQKLKKRKNLTKRINFMQ